jgi:hypothetical protein
MTVGSVVFYELGGKGQIDRMENIVERTNVGEDAAQFSRICRFTFLPSCLITNALHLFTTNNTAIRFCATIHQLILQENPMKNVEMKLNGNILTITVDLSKEFGKSTSGKSVIIGSTEGNVSVEGKEDVKVGLNVYRKP